MPPTGPPSPSRSVVACTRRSPDQRKSSARSGPSEMKTSSAMLKTESGQHGRRVIEREPNHIAVRAGDRAHEDRGMALHRIAAGLAQAFAARDIGRDLRLGET